MGGVLSLRQAAYLFVGAVLTALILLIKPIPVVVRVALAVPPLLLSIAMAFARPYGTSMELFIMITARYLTRNKKLYLRGDD